ncbi:MAG: nucleotidyltransferase family protein [Clostridia bacterium]|nr:nucleotidyltransferase family protein [Clostridia bacterium]
MKIGGIIAEYNPFHNGHEYQLSHVRTECEGIVAVMSGSVVQRGSIAMFDKFHRAKAAVLGGVDLVIELPCAYSLAPAELFSEGAIKLLNELGVVTDLYFGSEKGDTEALYKAAKIMLEEPSEISLKIKENLKSGMGYRMAQLLAYEGVIDSELLNLPNNILGIEYIKAITKTGSKIVPHALLREFANHNDTAPSNNFASGNAIRDIYEENKDISDYLPPATHSVYKDAKPFSRALLDAIVLYTLRVKGVSVFNQVFDAPPELVTRVLKAIPDATGLDGILNASSSRQFTNARIRRAILSALIGIDGKLTNSTPKYIRVLAFNDKGREILNEIKKNTNLPIITKAADYKEKSEMFEAEVRATELSSVCRGVKRGLDFTKSPEYVKLEDYSREPTAVILHKEEPKKEAPKKKPKNKKPQNKKQYKKKS